MKPGAAHPASSSFRAHPHASPATFSSGSTAPSPSASALGDGLALTGDQDGASSAFERALTLPEHNRRWREAAQAARAWARLLRAADRASEALDALDRAAVLDRAAEFALRLSQPGDLVFFGTGASDVTHVGIMVSQTEMVDAPHTGAAIRLEPYAWSDYLGATRPAT